MAVKFDPILKKLREEDGGGGAAGADGQIQYNNNGAVGASANFFFNPTTHHLGLTNTPDSNDNVVSIGVAGDALGPRAVNIIPARRSDTSRVASGNYAIAIGAAAKCDGDYSVAIGGGFNDGARASGNISIAIGNQTIAGGSGSISIGPYSEAMGSGSIVLGVSSEANAAESMAIGKEITIDSAHVYSIAIGRSVVTTQPRQMVIGRSNHNNPSFSFTRETHLLSLNVVIGSSDDTTNTFNHTPVTPEASAILQLEATPGGGQGFLPPRHTDTTRDAISSPATGLMVYNTTTNTVNVYNGTAWRELTDAAV